MTSEGVKAGERGWNLEARAGNGVQVNAVRRGRTHRPRGAVVRGSDGRDIECDFLVSLHQKARWDACPERFLREDGADVRATEATSTLARGRALRRA